MDPSQNKVSPCGTFHYGDEILFTVHKPHWRGYRGCFIQMESHTEARVQDYYPGEGESSIHVVPLNDIFLYDPSVVQKMVEEKKHKRGLS